MVKFQEIKSINPKLKQSEISKKLAISTSTLQRYKREINMLSPYRIILSSNTKARKQKTSNHTQRNLKMTSNDHKMTSNDFKMTSKDIKRTSIDTNKNTRNKIKGGNPSNIHISGKDLIEQAFSSN